MDKLTRFQLLGPATVFFAVLAADSAAYAVAVAPSSAFLWYLNLDVFSLFRKSRFITNDISALPFAQVFLFAGPLALLAWAGHRFRHNLLLAVSSNLTFVYAVFLAYGWVHWQSVGQQVRSASLSFVLVTSGSSLYLFATLMLASFFSFAISHIVYIRAARSRS